MVHESVNSFECFARQEMLVSSLQMLQRCHDCIRWWCFHCAFLAGKVTWVPQQFSNGTVELALDSFTQSPLLDGAGHSLDRVKPVQFHRYVAKYLAEYTLVGATTICNNMKGNLEYLKITL